MLRKPVRVFTLGPRGKPSRLKRSREREGAVSPSAARKTDKAETRTPRKEESRDQWEKGEREKGNVRENQPSFSMEPVTKKASHAKVFVVSEVLGITQSKWNHLARGGFELPLGGGVSSSFFPCFSFGIRWMRGGRKGRLTVRSITGQRKIGERGQGA